MKTIISLFILVASVSSFACPDISGTYFCDKEAEESMALGTRTVQFAYSPLMDIFSMKIGSEALLFEVDAWNPGINPSTGEIDHSTETMASCQGNTVILNQKVNESDGDISITIAGSYDVTPIAKGINLRLKIEGDEFYNFDCLKK